MQNYQFSGSQQLPINQAQLQQAQFQPQQLQQSPHASYAPNLNQSQMVPQPGIPQQSPQAAQKDQKSAPQGPQGTMNAPIPMMPYDPRTYGYPLYAQQNMQSQSPNPQQQQGQKQGTNVRQYQFAPAFYYPQYPYPQYQPLVPQIQTTKSDDNQKMQEESNTATKPAQDESERNQQFDSNAIQRKTRLTQPKWTKQDDERLQKLVKNTKGQWKKLSKIFNRPLITPLFLKNKYLELNPNRQQDIKKWVKYTILEDLMVAKYAKVYNKDWGKIALHFANRDTQMVKNRYYSHVHKEENKGLFDQAMALEEQYGCILDNMICDSTGSVVIGPKLQGESDSSRSGSMTFTSSNASGSEEQSKSKGQKSQDMAASSSSKEENILHSKKYLSNPDSVENSNSNNNTNTASTKVENMIQEANKQLFVTKEDWNQFEKSLFEKLDSFERNFKSLENEVLTVKSIVKNRFTTENSQ